MSERLRIVDIARCFEGAIPAAVATADARGVPNITYISRVHQVDDDRVALSNQFMSKTSRNLAVNPVAGLLLIDPATHEEFRLTIRFERTERRGPVFDRLRTDVERLAELSGLQEVFRLRAADVFRVLDIERVNGRWVPLPDPSPPARSLSALAELAASIDRAADLDAVIELAIDGLDRVLGYHHVGLLLLDEDRGRLFTIGGCGFPAENVGSEIELGAGPIGGAVQRCEIHRDTGLRQIAKYSRTVRTSFERYGVGPGREVPIPGLPDADSRIVVPLHALGQLVGALVIEHRDPGAFDAVDEDVLASVATILGLAIEQARSIARGETPAVVADDHDPTVAHGRSAGAVEVRYFAQDGSVFLDGDYLIKGVAGRILRSLVAEYLERGRTDYTNRELRLDRSLDLPGFKDNLESRLVLLKRRLDERGAPMRLDKTGRGRFRMHVDRPLTLLTIDD